jgi:hypothetical protein
MLKNVYKFQQVFALIIRKNAMKATSAWQKRSILIDIVNDIMRCRDEVLAGTKCA